MEIAIVGIQGLPNQYGGFETLAEFLVKYLGEKNNFTVYCSSVDQKQNLPEYNGAKLKYINVSSHGAKGILYDCKSLIDAVHCNFDVILILGFGPGLIVPFLSKKVKEKLILNFGGLDWKREKWSFGARKIIRLCERLLVHNSKMIVSDNVKIKEYIYRTYSRDSVFIAYGGDQVCRLPIDGTMLQKYPFLSGKYAFEVARIQADNNIEMLLKAFIQANKYPLVLVGNWKSSEYGRLLKKKYENEEQLVLLEAIYDRGILDVLRGNCYFYVHGHSAGGTNPSLCEAMYLGLPILAFSNEYNENTTQNKALYFENERQLKKIILSVGDNELQEMRINLKNIADRIYCWSIIAEQYNMLFDEIYNK